jgi:WD40 repeat protein
MLDGCASSERPNSAARFCVSSLAFSRDGKWLVAGSGPFNVKDDRPGLVTIWDVENKRIAVTRTDGFPTTAYVACSPVADEIATASTEVVATRGAPIEKGQVKIWNRALVLQHEFGELKGTISAIGFSPSGDKLVAGDSRGEVKVWDSKKRKLLFALPKHQGDVWAIAFSPSGKLLATADPGEHSVKIWDTGDANLKRTCRDAAVEMVPTSVVFTCDGNELVAGCWDGIIRIWDLESGKIVRRLEGHNKTVKCITLSADGTLLASGGVDGTVRLWNGRTGRSERVLTAYSRSVLAVAFSPDGAVLAAGGGEDQSPGQVRLWDVKTGEELARFK